MRSVGVEVTSFAALLLETVDFSGNLRLMWRWRCRSFQLINGCVNHFNLPCSGLLGAFVLHCVERAGVGNTWGLPVWLTSQGCAPVPSCGEFGRGERRLSGWLARLAALVQFGTVLIALAASSVSSITVAEHFAMNCRHVVATGRARAR